VSTPQRQGASKAAASRRARVEERRKAERAQQKRRRLLLVGAAVVAVALIAVGVVAAVSGGGKKGAATTAAQVMPSTPTGKVTTEQPAQRVADTSGIPGVLAWNTQGWPGDGASHPGALSHDHVDGPVRYSVTPPVGGPHSGTWMNAGVYDKPIPSERALHNIEHGALWITYRPSLAPAEVAALTAFAGRQSLIDEAQATKIAGQANRFVDLSPWVTNDLPAPIVISSWGRQLQVSSASDPRLQRFVDTFRNSATFTPEHGSPVDGVGVQTGGRPAAFGSTRPNPAGSAP